MNSFLSGFSFQDLIYSVPAVLIALTLHEYAHGYVSMRLGDPTPQQNGRLSFNPMHHLDPIGTLCLLLFGFGWAKPVMVNPGYYKDRKKGMAEVALAGPVMNFMLAFLFLLLYGIIGKLFYGSSNVIVYYFYQLFGVIASINIGLGVFNLIPFPPLDGAKVLGAVLPDQTYFGLMRYEAYGQILLFALLYLGFLDRILYFLRSGVIDIMLKAVNLLIGWL